MQITQKNLKQHKQLVQLNKQTDAPIITITKMQLHQHGTTHSHKMAIRRIES